MEQVYVPLPITQVIEEEEKPTKTYALDLEAGRIRGYVDGIDAVRQAIMKVLITPRFRCLIYDSQYGCELGNVIESNDTSEDFIKTAAEGFIRDALLVDSRIISIQDFSVELDGSDCFISFVADTIYGSTNINEVIAYV